MLTKERAFAIATSWGVYIRGDEPGACFYAFHSNDGRPVSEAHREECLRYAQSIRPSTKVGRKEIADLIHWLINAPVRPA